MSRGAMIQTYRNAAFAPFLDAETQASRAIARAATRGPRRRPRCIQLVDLLLDHRGTWRPAEGVTARTIRQQLRIHRRGYRSAEPPIRRTRRIADPRARATRRGRRRPAGHSPLPTPCL